MKWEDAYRLVAQDNHAVRAIGGNGDFIRKDGGLVATFSKYGEFIAYPSYHHEWYGQQDWEILPPDEHPLLRHKKLDKMLAAALHDTELLVQRVIELQKECDDLQKRLNGVEYCLEHMPRGKS